MSIRHKLSRIIYSIRSRLVDTPISYIPGLKFVYHSIYNQLSPTDVAWINLNGCKIKIDTSDDIGREIYHGNHEIEMTKIVPELINNGDVVIDVGGHYGYYTSIFRELVGENGQVIAVEPNPQNANRLKESISANYWTNVEVVQKAVSDRESEIILNSVGDGEGRSFIESAQGRESVADRVQEKFKVKTIGLSSLIKMRKFKKIALIKIDIEGAEVEALRTLDGKFNSVSSILIEIHSNQPDATYEEIYEILEDSPGSLSYVGVQKPVNPDTLSTTSANLLWENDYMN